MRRVLSWIAVVLATVTSVYAQRSAFVHIPGSPQDVVYLMRDSHAGVWVATVDDVQYFDGKRFYSLRQYGFPAERTISMAEDSAGGIWIATDAMDARDGVLRGGLYRYWNGGVEQILARGVESVVFAGDGTIIATVSRTVPWEFGDLYLFRQSSDGWRGTPILMDGAKWLTVDRQGSVLFPCRNGWCELSRSQIAHLPQEKLQLQSQGSTGQVNTVRVLRDSLNCVWFRSSREEDYKCPGLPQTKLPDTSVTLDTAVQLIESPDGTVLSAGANLLFGRPQSLHVIKASNGLPGKVTATTVAVDGTIYIGCNDGIYRLVYPLWLEYWNQTDGVDSPNSVLAAGRRTYLSQAGISLLNATRKHWVPWVDSSQVGTVKDLLPGPGGSLYAASQVRGVAQLNTSGHVLAKSNVHLDEVKLAQADQGSIWVGGSGIHQVTSNGNRLQLLPRGLDGGRAEDIQYDRKRHLLWACYDHEVVVRAGGQWEHISPKDGLVDDDCRSIALLANGDAWVGYQSNSRVSRIRRTESGKIRVDTFVGKNEGTRSGSQFLLTDNRGWLWRATEDALYLATPEEAAIGNWLPILELTKSPEFAGGATNGGFADSEGSIWYAQGVNVIHLSPPHDLANQLAKPALLIAGMTIGSGVPDLASAISEIPHGKSVMVHLGSPEFDRREAFSFRYRLLPGQAEWKEANNFDLDLGKLSMGEHTLEVQARILTGDWSDLQRKSFRVRHPIWLSWQILPALLMGGCILALGIVQRSRRKRRARDLRLPDISGWRAGALSPESEAWVGSVAEGRYEIDHVLSVGGFATVMRARDLSNAGRLCAVKIFRLEPSSQDWIQHRFRQEVTALEELSHPNIVRITGHGWLESGEPYLTMEFIHGRTLRELLANGPISGSRISGYLGQLAGALALLHRSSIYHRDIKPENLMIRADEDGEQMVLIDFSIAIVKSPDETFHGISRVAGTLGYMAPEQVTGYADATTDIHSLAKVVIEMLTGLSCADLLPEARLDLPEQVLRHFTRSPGLLSLSSISMIASALTFDPVHRPKDVWTFVTPIMHDLNGASMNGNDSEPAP